MRVAREAAPGRRVGIAGPVLDRIPTVLHVFLTVDTEIWPFVTGWPVTALPPAKADFSAEIAGYIRGETASGDYGVPFQIEMLNRNGLKATYFVEALFAGKAGAGHLRDIVRLVQDGGHEVQLHAHTEWLRELSDPDLPARFQQHIRQFSEDEQTRIIARGVANLRQAGARKLCAFRAGNYGASFDTLRALARNGIAYDSSHNTCYMDSDCWMPTGRPLLQPQRMEGVVEFPVSFFSDYPGHYRHAQLCACSFQEVRTALLDAWQAGWYAFVIVWHGFELVRNVGQPDRRAPDPVVIGRFKRLARFLGENRDKFRTTLFSEVDAAAIPVGIAGGPLRSRPWHTAWRYAEQLASRML